LGTAVAIERWTQSVGNRVDVFEPCFRSVEKIQLVRGQAGDWTSGAWSAASDTWIDGLLCPSAATTRPAATSGLLLPLLPAAALGRLPAAALGRLPAAALGCLSLR
jgi:hypothetical protein